MQSISFLFTNNNYRLNSYLNYNIFVSAELIKNNLKLNFYTNYMNLIFILFSYIHFILCVF